MKQIHLLCILALFLLSCEDENKVESEIAKIEVDFKVERFDKILSNVKENELGDVKENYPFLFPKIIDSVWVNQFKSDLQQQIFKETENVFNDFEAEAENLVLLFQHLKYYDNTFKSPRVITVADYVDYRTKLVFQADLLIINLSNYLGKAHEFYQNIPVYFSENMRPKQIVPDVTEKLSQRYIFQNQRKTFLDEIIYHGKQLYFKDIMIPDFSEAEKIGYTEADIKWAQENEAQIWSYFVEKELLFKTDPKLFTRFTVPAPFSKFFLELDNESPPRLGQYIGWQIVKAYAKRNDADIMAIMRTDADKIFAASKYKPNR